MRSYQRLSVVEVATGVRPEDPARFRGHLRDELVDDGERRVLCDLSIKGRTGEMAILEELSLSPAHLQRDDLLGASAYRGFRRQLDILKGLDADNLALRRLLWDLPLTIMIGMQSRIIDHPEIPERDPTPTPLLGINQCAGWVAGGQMLQLIDASAGRLRMEPSPVLVGTDHLGDPNPTVLSPYSTRRRRRLEVRRDDGMLQIDDEHRDSFADPDGIERVLHNWKVRARADEETGVLMSIDVSSGALPWVECPSAAGSGGRLVGRRFDELETLIATEFTGITTCTHLNDTLATLAAVPELLAETPS